MTALKGRISRLEHTASTQVLLPTPVYQECGRMPNGQFPPGRPVNYTTGFDDPLHPVPEHCSTCGVRMRTVYRIEFDERG